MMRHPMTLFHAERERYDEAKSLFSQLFCELMQNVFMFGLLE
jgi:hypothetical protein